MGSGAYPRDVSGRPYALMFGELYRRGHDIADLARICGFSDDVARRLVFDEAPRIRRETAYKALRAVTLVPPDHWLGSLGMDDAKAYRTGEWLETA